MNGGLWGLSEAQISQFGLSFGIGAFVLYMLFIVWSLARESKAGRFGTFVLFLVLSFGMVGFLVKGLIQWLIGI